MVEIKYNNQGESIGISVIEIMSIPSYKLLSDNIEDALSKNRKDFMRWMSEIYSIASGLRTQNSPIGDVSAEITWATSPAVNQPYAAESRMFFVIRNICANDDIAKSVNAALVQALKSKLISESFNFKEISTEEYWSSIDLKDCSCQALVKHESAETTAIPTIPVIYSFGRISYLKINTAFKS